MKIIFDSSSLILFIEKLNLRETLRRCREDGIEFIIPEAVWLEFTEKNNDKDILTFIKTNFEIIKTSMCEEFNRLLDSDSGEMGVAYIATELKNKGIDYFCIIDESYGSRVCKLKGLKVRGSIGFLLFLKERGLVSSIELLEIRDKIDQSNFRIKPQYLDKLC